MIRLSSQGPPLCGRLSPSVEDPTSDIDTIAFASDPDNYEEYLQARSVAWDLAMQEENSEHPPPSFFIASDQPDENDEELSPITPTLGLFRFDLLAHERSMQCTNYVDKISSQVHSVLFVLLPPSLEGYGLSPRQSSVPSSMEGDETFDLLRAPASPPLQCPIRCPSLRRYPSRGDIGKVVELFTYEEITHEDASFVPALILRRNEVIGDRIIDSKNGGYFHYDTNVLDLHGLVDKRSFREMPEGHSLADNSCLENYAVRLFLEVAVPREFTPRSTYKYIGDFYLQKTDEWLDTKEWTACNTQAKTTVIDRFIQYHSSAPNDGYRTRMVYMPNEVAKLYQRGRMIPKILLHPTYRCEGSTRIANEEAFPSPLLDIREVKDSFALLYPDRKASSSDSASIYSQDSTPRSLIHPPSCISISYKPTSRGIISGESFGLRSRYSGQLEQPVLDCTSTLVESVDGVTMNEPEEELELADDIGFMDKCPKPSCDSYLDNLTLARKQGSTVNYSHCFNNLARKSNNVFKKRGYGTLSRLWESVHVQKDADKDIPQEQDEQPRFVGKTLQYTGSLRQRFSWRSRGMQSDRNTRSFI